MSTVLVTGAGGAATPAMICDLRNAGHRVIACDMDPYAAGLWTADKGYVIPAGKDPNWLPVLQRICDVERVSVVIPLVDEELLPAWELTGVQILAPRPVFIRIALDKYETAKLLRAIGVPVPTTNLASDAMASVDTRYPAPYSVPWVLKPRTGRGSRHVSVVRGDIEALARLDASGVQYNQMLFQERIAGTEYTVSVVAWRDGQTLAVVPKEVIDKRGITRQAVTRHNTAIEDVCRKIQSELRADGPFNVQLMLDADGVPWVFEINPRFSSSTSLTVAARVDEVNGLVDLATGGTWCGGDFAEGVVMVRQTLDVIMSESEYRGRRIERA